LDCNFRSSPALIAALNALFDKEMVRDLIPLPRHHATIDYTPVKAGGKVTDKDFHDGNGSVHAILMEMEKYHIEEIDQQVFPFVADEIRRLHQEQGLGLQQFAVLVADRYQAARLIDYLRQWNIPAVYQREESLARSKAVKALRELLSALINPRDESPLKIALGGPIIGWTHHQVNELSDLAKLQPVIEKCLVLRQLLWEKGFSFFIDRFMETIWNDAGLSVEEVLLSREEGRALLDEWTQVCDWLIDCHAEETPELLIDELFALEGNEHQETLRAQNSGDPVVQVMSIHLSKGLEFDIVFPIGLYKRSKKPDSFIPVPDKSGWYSLKAVDESSADYAAYCEELNAEKMRQLYVAMTRAKYRLYLFFVFSELKEMAVASPMELYLSRCGDSEKAVEEKLLSLTSHVNFTYSKSFDDIVILPLTLPQPQTLVAPAKFPIPGSPFFLKSYTLLSKAVHNPASTLSAPSNYASESKTSHTLPAGSEIGILLHGILESIAFEHAGKIEKPEGLMDLIRPHLLGTPFLAWDHVICHLVYAVLHTSFFDGVPPLAGIRDAECYREIEFVFPAGKDYGFNGYLKGVIDLVFRYGQNYYLVDWKSNWLGPDIKDYCSANLRKAMEDNHYFLQAAIYQEAIQRYLTLVDKEASVNMAYVFLRGLPEQEGIFHL
jgi:exodeoxyribonuclease V beta subunit